MTAPLVLPTSTVDTAALRASLERVLNGYFGTRRSVTALERRVSPYSSSFIIEELDVTLDDHVRLALIFKDLSPEALRERGRWVKPTFLYDAEREIDVYRTVLARAGLGTATYYGAVISPERKRYWLFLDRVPGVPLWQFGDFDAWEEAARWLAVMHTRLQPERAERSPSVAAKWLHYTKRYYRRWMRRAVHCVRRKDPAALDTLRKVTSRYGALVKRLIALPTTFIHGEFYPSNVLVQRDTEGVRICPIDWEMAAVGPSLMDLSALTSGVWTRAQQGAMVAAYRKALIEEQGRAPDLEALLVGVDCCRLFQAVTWLGWSLQWEPPPEHARNWLHEAVTLAERLAL